ncbi:MAG TPA: lysophospholipid acyltransferase family protein [Myxococcota bacterium]
MSRRPQSAMSLDDGEPVVDDTANHGASDVGADGGFDPFGKDPAVIATMKPRLDALLDKWFRVVVEGESTMPRDGRVILVANHGGALPWDALVIMHALSRATSREVRPLVEDPVITAPFLGTLMSRLGCVRASQDNGSRLLARGEPVLVFPEGVQGLGKTWGRRHQLQRFGRGGFVRLAVRTKTLLVPVAVVGGEETAPLVGKVEALKALLPDALPWLPITPTFPLFGPLGLLPLPARWRLRFGEPIDPARTIKDEGDAVAINALAATIRDRLQKDVHELVEARGSAYL